MFLPNVPGATFIQGGTFIPESRVDVYYFLYELILSKYWLTLSFESLTPPKTGLIVNEPYLLHKKGVGRNSLTVH